MLPILETMKARLSFLDARGPTGWSLPFVSTVTGKVETQVDAEYWCVVRIDWLDWHGLALLLRCS